jgi:hypothetical protein
MDSNSEFSSRAFTIDKMDGPRDQVTELLDTMPHLSTVFTEGKYLDFGNSGFGMNLDAPTMTFDFVPEQMIWPSPKKATKYASILCASFLSLYKLLNNPEEMSRFGFDDSKDTMYALTNRTMIEAIRELFSKSNTPNLAKADKDIVSIDLVGFKKLTETDPLITHLKHVSERVRGTTVTYFKTVEQP